MWTKKSRLEKENEDLRNHIRNLEEQMYELRADLKWAEEDVEHTMDLLREMQNNELRWYEKVIRNVFS